MGDFFELRADCEAPQLPMSLVDEDQVRTLPARIYSTAVADRTSCHTQGRCFCAACQDQSS